MIKLKTLLLESTDNLYHSTGVREIRDILKSNTIKLTYSHGTRAELNYQRGRPFYFSMSREKVGRYVRGSNSRDTLYPKNWYSIIELDGRLLSNNYKIIPVDYWQSGRDRSESEDRLVAYKNSIPNANKYIKGIHVYINLEDLKKRDKRVLHIMYEMNKEANDKNIPLYYYTDPNAYMQLRTSKSVDIPDIISDPQDFSKEDTTYYNNLMKRKRDHYGEELLHMWLDKPAINQKNYDRLLNYMTQYPYSLYIQVINDIHNNKMYHPTYTQKLAYAVKNSKSDGLKEFILKVMNKMREKEGLTPISKESYEKHSH